MINYSCSLRCVFIVYFSSWEYQRVKGAEGPWASMLRICMHTKFLIFYELQKIYRSNTKVFWIMFVASMLRGYKLTLDHSWSLSKLCSLIRSVSDNELCLDKVLDMTNLYFIKTTSRFIHFVSRNVSELLLVSSILQVNTIPQLM